MVGDHMRILTVVCFFRSIYFFFSCMLSLLQLKPRFYSLSAKTADVCFVTHSCSYQKAVWPTPGARSLVGFTTQLNAQCCRLAR
ncbi:hypothetical protein BJX99DRAFT_219480 [Aspergillus californicus]